MRPKIIVPVLLLGCSLVMLLLWVSQRSSTPSGAQNPEASEQASTTLRGTGAAATANAPAVAPVAPQGQSKPLDTASAGGQDAGGSDDLMNQTPEARHAAFVSARVTELQDLGAADDLDSLNAILSELDNRDPEIRKAALEATVQFGSRDAIPKLEDAQLQAEDPHEKAAIADAIEFLELPSFADSVAQKGHSAPNH